jgi:hypothetical protein
LGAVAVVGTYGAAWELAGALNGGRRRFYVALGAGALTAFNPMFVFVGARLGNDAAVAAFGALVIWGCARLAVRGLSRRGMILLGAAYGLATLSKLSGVTLGPAIALALLLDALRRCDYSPRRLLTRTQLSRLFIDALLLFDAAVLAGGWWYVRNYRLYGEFLAVDAWISRTATVWSEPIGFFEVIPLLEGMEMSYWAMFGWFNIPVAPWMYVVWRVLVRVAVVGLGVLLVRQLSARRLSRSAGAGLVVVALCFLLNFGSVWRFLMVVPGAQGRYLFPVIAAVSTLLMLGLVGLVGRRAEGLLAVVLAASHLAATLAVLILFVLPAYARPEIVDEVSLPEDMNRLEIMVADTSIQLIGGVIEVDEAHPGQGVPVSVYWRALEPVHAPFVNQVRLLGGTWERIGGTDGYAGNGSFPPNLWEPGLIYRERYLLPVDDTAAAPALMRLQTGMRIRGEEPLGFTLPSGEPWAGNPALDTIPLRSVEQPSDDVSYPVASRMGTSLTLLGADLSSGILAPGSSVTVTLVWRAEAAVPADYTVFVHLIDQDGELMAQNDAPALNGAYPTSWWAPGDVLRTPYTISAPDDLPAGLYTLHVGMYDPAASVRVPAVDGEGNPFDDESVPVTTLEVR